MVKMNSSVRGNSVASLKYDLEPTAQLYTECPTPYTTNHDHT